MHSLAGKTALITGASRGIGRAIAAQLAAAGAAAAINYARSAESAHRLAAEIQQAGGRAIAIQADCSRVDEIRRLFAAVVDQLGAVDIVVNNAAVAAYMPIAEASEEDFDRIFHLNARGAFFVLQEAARSVRDEGRIINISTGATLACPEGSAIYSGSKAALEVFTRVLARELAPRRITVNTVSPGITETDMMNGIAGLREFAMANTPLGRVGEPDDIAAVVAFLASAQARWITGQNIQVSGGLNMA